MSATIRGDKKFLKAVSTLGGAELDKLNTRALRRAGRRVRLRAQRGYLSGNPLRKITGELFNSIGLESSQPAQFIRIGSPLPQAMPLHFGWPRHNMRARPWLFPALEDEIPKFSEIWVDEMDRAVGAVR